MPYLGKSPARGLVGATDVDDDAIDSQHYAAGSIDTAHIADDQITLGKIASGTDGELITWDASGNPAAVGAGTSGQFLKSQGAGSVPVFAAASGGLTHVSTTSVTSAAATLNVGGIDDSASHWQIRYTEIDDASTANQNGIGIFMNFGSAGDTNIITTGSYSWTNTSHNHYNNGNAGDNYRQDGDSDDSVWRLNALAGASRFGNVAGTSMSMIVDIFHPGVTDQFPTVSWNMNACNDSGGSAVMTMGVGMFEANSVITNLKIYLEGSVTFTGRASLYKFGE